MNFLRNTAIFIEDGLTLLVALFISKRLIL